MTSLPNQHSSESQTDTDASSSALLQQSQDAVQTAVHVLEQARELAHKAGLSVDRIKPKDSTVLETTGGHSNTDHLILQTGDYETDRIAELQRRLSKRQRALRPESKGDERWDKKRAPGERRRRIARDADAPYEPPPSGYVIFVGQMTTKIRHDRPNELHNQTKAVQEISKIWRIGLTVSKECCDERR